MNHNRPWVSASTSPVFMRRLNGWLTLFWIFMIPVSIFTGWIHSVTYVAVLSLWALVSGHWAAWQAARVEVHQEQDADVQDVLDELRKVVVEIRANGTAANGSRRLQAVPRQLAD